MHTQVITGTPTIGTNSGVTIYQGSGIPSNSIGRAGDFYERTDTAGVVYKKDDAAWSVHWCPSAISLSRAWDEKDGIMQYTSEGTNPRRVVLWGAQVPRDLCTIGSRVLFEIVVAVTGANNQRYAIGYAQTANLATKNDRFGPVTLTNPGSGIRYHYRANFTQGTDRVGFNMDYNLLETPNSIVAQTWNNWNDSPTTNPLGGSYVYWSVDQNAATSGLITTVLGAEITLYSALANS